MFYGQTIRDQLSALCDTTYNKDIEVENMWFCSTASDVEEFHCYFHLTVALLRNGYYYTYLPYKWLEKYAVGAENDGKEFYEKLFEIPLKYIHKLLGWDRSWSTPTKRRD